MSNESLTIDYDEKRLINTMRRTIANIISIMNYCKLLLCRNSMLHYNSYVLVVSLALLPTAFAQTKSADVKALIRQSTLYQQNNCAALQYYHRAFTIDPNNANASNDVGIGLCLGNYTAALQYYNKASAIAPNNVGTLLGKGLSLHSLEKYDEAISSLTKL